MSGEGTGGRRNDNGAVSGQDLPLKILSTTKPLKIKKLRIDFKSYHETVSVNSLYYFVCCIENKYDYLAKEHHFRPYRVMVWVCIREFKTPWYMYVTGSIVCYMYV